jgi:hypothetical protein
MRNSHLLLRNNHFLLQVLLQKHYEDVHFYQPKEDSQCFFCKPLSKKYYKDQFTIVIDMLLKHHLFPISKHNVLKLIKTLSTTICHNF